MAISKSRSTNKSEEDLILNFNLFHISEKESTKFTFEEHLKLVNESGKVVDEVTVSVEPRPQDGGGGGGFDVFQYSMGEDLLLRVSSHVTPTLETVSEVRKISSADTEKMLRIMNLPDVYRLFMVETNVQQKEGSRANKQWSKSECEPFILEGANVLLLRKLATSWHFGKFRAFTVVNDGVFSEAYYKVEFLNQGEVQVTRVVGSETMTTVLSSQGRILHHKWSGSQWRLESSVPRYKSRSSSQYGGEGDRVGLEPGAEEEEPAVDLPAYWQRKAEVLAELREYMVEYSDVEDMIGDLMKNILFEKPEDPVDFADSYLSEFMGISRDPDKETVEVDKSTSDCSVINLRIDV